MGFLDWLKRIFHPKKNERIPTIAEIHKKDNYETVEYHPNPKVEEESQKFAIRATEYLKELKEEQVKREFLPEPQIHRRTTSKSYIPPAEQHRDSISKFMKGKASNRYLKTIKQSPKIKIEEEN